MRELTGGSGAPIERLKNAQSRRTTIRLLWLLIVTSIVLPLVLLGIASFISYRELQALGLERMDRTQAVMQEHALKVFQSLTLALDTIDDMLRNRTAQEVEADGQRIHERIKQINARLPEVQSIWIFGPAGNPQVITREYPAPSSQDFSKADYFAVPRDGRPGTYVGEIHRSVTGGKPYFTFSRARYMADGTFAGVIELSLLPNDFSRFYARLANAPGLQFALIRDDGLVLARYPEIEQINARLSERSGFFRTISAHREGGLYKTVSEVDRIERNFGVRRIPGFPIYASAGIATDQLRNEWMKGMAFHLIFGIPATCFLCGTLFVVLQRTRRLYAEQDRRLDAEETLRQSQKLEVVGQLTGGIAHDFNNLLTVIIGNAEMLQRQLQKGSEVSRERVKSRADLIMQGARRAAALTSKLLAFSRQQPLAPKVIDINHLMNGLSDFLRRTLGEDISLEVVSGGGLWPVEIDPAQLESAILNLAVNARDAMPNGGKLTIEASNCFLDDLYSRNNTDVLPGQYVQIAISDTGTGMSKDVIARVFEPFFTTKPSGQGTGLGLSQVYGFVKQSGGHIKIYSEPDEGTTVKIHLRRHIGPVTAPEEPTPSVRGSNSAETILIVEDDPDVRAYIAEALIDMKYHVLQAPNGEAALKQLSAYDDAINLLLTDVVMPGMNGRKLSEIAKEKRPEMKVLFMTGYSRNAIIHQGRLDPGVDFVQKPITTAELSAAVRKVLDS
jgi:two-component system, NtrC family, sensor kinase